MEERLILAMAERSKRRLAVHVERYGMGAVNSHDAALAEIQENIRLWGGNPDSSDIIVGMLLAADAMRMLGAPPRALRCFGALTQLAAEGCSDRDVRSRFNAIINGSPEEPEGKGRLLRRVLGWFA